MDPPSATTAPPSAAPSADRPSSGTPSTPPSWEQTVADVRSGVLRLQVAGCDSTWTGTGFLTEHEGEDGFVVTAAHVARNASTVSVKGDRGIVRAQVVDWELSADTALLRLQQDLAGHRFEVTPELPGLGVDVGILGYPFSVTDLRLSRGTISGGDIAVTYGGDDGFTVDHVITTDAAINGGNSGGPAISLDGQVVGLVSGNRNWNGALDKRVPGQGNNLLVPADVITDKLEGWDGEEEAEPASCEGDDRPPVPLDYDLDVTVESDDPAADDVALALYAHGDSINQGAYSAAWEVFTP